jgi:hypothetical protein
MASCDTTWSGGLVKRVTNRRIGLSLESAGKLREFEPEVSLREGLAK